MAKPIDRQYLIDNMKTFVNVILDPRYIIQKAVLPQATADNLGAVFQYIGSDSTNYTIGGFYQCQSNGETPATYSWVEITTKTNFDNITIKENSSKQIYVPTATDSALGVVQAGDGISVDSDGVISVVARLEEIDELPTAAAALEGKIYLLTAAQTGYDRGGIYMCEESTETAGTYEWKLISMSPLEAGKGITIEDDVISADTNVFNGTLDEWEALTAEEQAQYTHIASPDEDTYSSLPFTDITSQITMANDTEGNPIFNNGSGSSQWDIFSCTKYGRMVIFSVCFGTFTGKVTSGYACFTGLPKAVVPAETGGSFDTRWFINQGETSIKLYFSRASSELENTATRFQLVYFTE